MYGVRPLLRYVALLVGGSGVKKHSVPCAYNTMSDPIREPVPNKK